MKAEASSGILKEVASLVLMAVFVLFIADMVAEELNLFSPSDTTVEGIQGQTLVVQDAITAQHTMMKKDNKDSLQGPPIPLSIDKNFMLAFFSEDDQQVRDGCTHPPTLLPGRCDKEEFIPRDVSCGKRACVCAYQFQPATLLPDSRTCIAKYHLLPPCKPLPIDVINMADKTIYGKCLESEPSIKKIRILLANNGARYRASIQRITPQ